ncbi:MAG: BlaI/MecI/CopY family transcriptional regulator [Clostridia bacterium]|nr:BlaI/MecI/CopY family transcriptional regulator [Clostridia bacterium]
MSERQLGAAEAKFADIIWEKQPVPSGVLAKEAEKEFGWKKTTAYTVLKRLSDKGLFINDGGTVKALISRDEFYSGQSKRFVEESFGGSLPAFLAAFSAGKGLTAEEVASLRRFVDEYEEGL